MTINHRAEAERLLALAYEPGAAQDIAIETLIGEAQVHAALAAGETGAADISSCRHAIYTYRFALIRHIGEGLALSEGDEAHQHALGLAKYLDSVDLNVDREVDAYIEEHCGYAATRDVRKPPTARRAEWDATPPW